MIEILGVRKANKEDFELVYVDHEKKKEKGYLRGTRYGTEAKLRKLKDADTMRHDPDWRSAPHELFHIQ